MLILSRKLNEQIVIGSGIVVTVVSIRGGSVRLGIEAPADVPVHRKEVHEALLERKRLAEAAEEKTDSSSGRAKTAE